ncbi:MAG: ABC transporter permease [Dehalococcoidia bacterium]
MLKILRDAWVIGRIHAYPTQREPVAYFVFVVVFPLAMLAFARGVQPEGSSLDNRLIAGSMVFSLGISTVNSLAQTLLMERFNHQLQMLVVSPVHRLSYALGALGFGALRGTGGVLIVLLAAPLLGFDVQLSPWLLPIALLTAASMAGLSLVIGTWSPDFTTGNLMAQVVGILIVMLSPVYFSLSRLPDWLQWPARFSPYTHATDAIQGAISGSTPFGAVAVLAALTAVTISLGIAGMRWRDI